MSTKKYMLYLLFATLLLPASLFAQVSESSESSFFHDVKQDIKESREKIVSLAEAIPADKYTWRPAEGVRSVSEVLMHIAGANYYLLSFAGITTPEGATEEMGKDVTDKDKVISAVKTSFDDLDNNLQQLNDADLENHTKMFGQDASTRAVIFTEMGHLHEHLGQLIAYARMIGVVPPWSK